MRRHLRIRPVDLRIIEAGLDDGGFRVVRHDQLRNAADGGQRADVGVDPIRQRLRPARVRKGEARRAEHGHEDLRHPDFAGEPIDDDRHAVARVVDEQSLPAACVCRIVGDSVFSNARLSSQKRL